MTPERALALLPDIPRWVEARGSLLTGRGQVIADSAESTTSFLVREHPLVTIVGKPNEGLMASAIDGDPEVDTVLAPLEIENLLRAQLPGWRCSRAILHLLSDVAALPEARRDRVAFMEPGFLDRLTGVPDELLEELRDAATHSPIMATLVSGAPVSFCYAGSVTETLWDISIDTLEPYRRSGYATLCVTAMIRHMRAAGKEPVWGADASNPGSWRLAEKLGFQPVDEIALFERQ